MIPYYKPWTSGEELPHIAKAIDMQGGPDARHYTQACERWLESYTGCLKAFLTPSCTAALEMAAILADIRSGDEVIMSSFTFPSMANAFVLRGAVPVFVDIREDTLNLDERLIEQAITPRTRAVVVMHYGGVACEMDAIMALARKYGLLVIEDAAHALGATYKGRPLGSIGHLATFSFHRTKNIQCGEGGALLINDSRFCERAEVVRENGTDRVSFINQKVPHYSWVDIGSSFIISEFSAAFLWAQLAQLNHVLEQRRRLWQQYQEALHPDLAATPLTHNAHIFHVVADSPQQRRHLLEALGRHGIQGAPHYQPLHTSQAGRRHGKVSGELAKTITAATCLLRLPLWTDLMPREVDRICGHVRVLMQPPATTACARPHNLPAS